MRSLLVLSLLAATFAFVPSADALCAPNAVACTSSYGYGDCTTGGYATNIVTASPPVAGASATSECQSNGSESTSGFRLYAATPVGWGQMDWRGTSDSCGGSCSSSVDMGTFASSGHHELPLCELAGRPPAVPALLP